MPDALSDPLPEEMAAAYARYLRTVMGMEPKVLATEAGAEVRAAASPFDILIERDTADPQRINIRITPKPSVTVAAVVRR